MASHFPRLTPSPTEKVVCQDTSFSVDAIARNFCNTWEEAMTNPAFDVVVVGCGMYGGYLADKLFRESKTKRMLLLEAGAFLIPEHFQNIAAIGFDLPDPIDPADDKGFPRDFV